MNISIRLSLCIPTYNRNISVLKQLAYLKNELSSVDLSLIEILVQDNASSDQTSEVLKEFQKDNDWFSYYVNGENLGLVGNLNSLALKANGEFIWFIGDDDILEPGLLNKVLNILQGNFSVSWIFLNHDVYYNYPGKPVFKTSFSGVSGYREDGKNAITEIFLESGTSPMFITACIYKSCHLTKYKSDQYSNELVKPLEYSFHSASMGSIYIEDSICIHNIWGATSWAEQQMKIMYYDVNIVLRNLSQFSYTNKQIRQMLQSRLSQFMLFQLRNLIKDNGYSLELFKYYKLKHWTELITKIYEFLKNKYVFK